MSELKTGIQGHSELSVTKEHTASTIGSGLLDVFATPSMIAMMEKTAFESITEFLDEGTGTVGVSMNVKHISATPVGMKVFCDTELIKVDGRALTFSVKAYDEAGLIGEGTHERFIIINDKFMAKAHAKLG